MAAKCCSPAAPKAAPGCPPDPGPLEGDRQGFPRGVRLTEAADYRRVFQRSRNKSSDRWMTVLALPNQAGHARLGLAVSRKVDKRAVARNRIKRLIRESFRHHQTELPELDLVIIARPGAAGQSSAALRRALEQHWTRLIRQCAES